MGELCERILEVHPWQSSLGDPRKKDKILTDGLQACMRLVRIGTMTVPQAETYFADNCGSALGNNATFGALDSGRSEVQALLATIPQVTAAPGGTTANQLLRLNQQMAQVQRLATIEAVLVMADAKADPFDTPEKLRVALGLPPEA